MTDPQAAAGRVTRLYHDGRLQEAFDLAAAAAGQFPQSPMSQANFGFLLMTRREHAAAAAAYRRALALDPHHAEARRGLAAARVALGLVSKGDAISVLPFTGVGRAIDLLVPVTLGSGNLVLDGLLDPSVFRITKLAVELHGPDDPLPACDVAFNAIGDADAAANALASLERMCACAPFRMLNDPSRIATTGRVDQSRRLGLLPGVRTPRIERISRDDLRSCTPPLLLRAPGYHAGEHFELASSRAQIEAVASRMPDGELLAIEFLDLREPDGNIAKYRAIFVDGALYPGHLAISRDWKVHYFSAEMGADSSHRAREARFLADPRAALGERAWVALQEIAAACGLQYLGVDFGLDSDGTVVVFECNATMAVRLPPGDPMWRYREEPARAIASAVTRMFERYSSI